MNADELADKIEDARNETDFQRWASDAPDMLRQQADRITELEKKNQTLKVGIGLLKGISKMAEDYEKRTTPQIKPLSDEEIADMVCSGEYWKVDGLTIVSVDFDKFARAIEAKVRGDK